MKNLLIIIMVSVIVAANSTNLKAKKKQPITLKQTIEINRVGSSKVSPDGRYIAYTKIVPRTVYKDNDGKPFIELYVNDTDGQSRRFISGKQRLGGIAWGPKSHFIYFLAQRDKDLHVNIYRIAVDGGEAEKIVTSKSDILAFTINFDASAMTYIAKPEQVANKEKLEKKGFKVKVYEESVRKTSAYRVNINHKKSLHVRLPIEQHIISIQYHPKNNHLLARVAQTPLIDDRYVASKYHIYQQDGKLIKAFDTTGKLGMARWSNDGKYIAFIGSEDKHDPATGRLFITEVHTGKITESVKNYQGHIKGLQWLSDYQLAFIGHVGTKSEVSILNLDNQSVIQAIPPGNELLSYLHADLSGKVLVAIGSSDSHPRELMKLSNGNVSRLTESNSWLEEVTIPKQQTIRYTARDGVQLEGILIYPIDYRKRKRYPLIMMIHGGPESHISDGWLDKYTYPIKYAAANGFAIFLPNYRGSTGRGVEFSKMGQADYAGGEFNDLVDAIAHLSEMGIIDKKRVGITGGSYGGYASAWAATALSEHFAASVMFVGISDQLSKFGTTDIPKEMYNAHARSYPWEKWQWMLERSPIFHTDQAKTPLLIMHGEDDTRVHPSQSMELYRYIKTRTDTPVRLVLYPDEGHGNKKSAAQLDYSMRLMRWMEFYLKGARKSTEKPEYELGHGKIIENKES